MQIIPLSAVQSQNLTAALGGQTCQINVYQKDFSTDAFGTLMPFSAVFLDLYVNNAPIITGVLCLNNVRIVRDAYLGFIGDLVFTDTQGSTDPLYAGLGDRYTLVYLEASDL